MTRFKELAVISSRVAADDYKDEKLLPSCLVRDSCLHGPEGATLFENAALNGST